MTETDKRVQFEEEEELSPREKAAILMVALGKEAAGEVMKHLADFEIEEMTQIITELKNLPTAIQDRVLEEFEQHLLAGEYRIATLDNITPSVLKQIEESLETNLRDILGGHQDVGGPKIVADMLNLTGATIEKSVLEKLDAQDPEVAETVRNMMFVFDDIDTLTDREIQVVLREVEQKDLVVALKAASDEVKDKILGNMSERVRDFIEEEMEFLGPMRLSEVEDVQLRVVQKVRQLEEQGQVNIVRGATDDQFV